MMMNMTKVAIQGYRGCFHEQAAREFYSARGEEISIVECPTFEGLFKAVASGEAQAAVMAIENTISGGLIPNFELLRSNPYKIKGEVYIPHTSEPYGSSRTGHPQRKGGSDALYGHQPDPSVF